MFGCDPLDSLTSNSTLISLGNIACFHECIAVRIPSKVENVSASAARRDDERDTTWTRWTRKATLSENRIMVNDIQFAPRHLGLKLATASADG